MNDSQKSAPDPKDRFASPADSDPDTDVQEDDGDDEGLAGRNCAVQP